MKESKNLYEAVMAGLKFAEDNSAESVEKRVAANAEVIGSKIDVAEIQRNLSAALDEAIRNW